MAKHKHFGDGGETQDFAGHKISKGDCLIESLGDVDELIAHLGLVKYIVKNEAYFITKIQLQLQSFLSTIADYPSPTEHLALTELDYRIEELESNFRYDDFFYLPGGKEIPTFINITRTICRRAERSIAKQKQKNSKILPFLNRLSTYLYALLIYYDKI